MSRQLCMAKICFRHVQKREQETQSQIEVSKQSSNVTRQQECSCNCEGLSSASPLCFDYKQRAVMRENENQSHGQTWVRLSTGGTSHPVYITLTLPYCSKFLPGAKFQQLFQAAKI